MLSTGWPGYDLADGSSKPQILKGLAEWLESHRLIPRKPEAADEMGCAPAAPSLLRL